MIVEFWGYFLIRRLTAVEAHKTSTGHETTYEDFEVIGREKSRNSFHLKVKESLLIKVNIQDFLQVF